MSDTVGWMNLSIGTVMVAASLFGCGPRYRPYSIEVENKTTNTIYDATVKFDDGSWQFVFGDIGTGLSASYGGEQLPFRGTATVSWAQAVGGPSQSQNIPLPTVSLPDLVDGNLVFKVEANGTVTSSFIR